jgi:Domain of unknown function (DUF4173)
VGVAAAGILLGVWADVLFHGQPLGLNVLLWTVAFAAALAALLRIARAPLHQGRRWMLAPLLVFSAAFLWHDSPLLMAVNLLALAGAVVLGALRRHERGIHQSSVGDYAVGFAAAGGSAAAGAVHLLHRDIDWEDVGRSIRVERSSAVARGLALGVPLVVLFGGLFMAADAVFKSFITAAVPQFDHPLAHVLLILVAAWVTAGLLRDLLAPRDDDRLVSPSSLGGGRFRDSLGPTEMGIALGALNLLFLAFVLVQFRYLFGGRELVESRVHLTYAQYARHGFFELLAVSVLVLAVLLVMDALARRNARIVRLLSGGLVALVFVVMASALERMHLYEKAYGLTELRVYAVGVILWLAAVFLWFCATVLRRQRDLFAVGAVVAGFVATGALNVVNPDALIARTNLDRPRVDAAYVAGLSDDAVPSLLERLPSLRPDLRRAIADELLGRGENGGDWRSFNLARSRAADLLSQHHAELLRYAVK